MSKTKFWFPRTYVLEGRELPSKQTKCDSSECCEESRESACSRGSRVPAGGGTGRAGWRAGREEQSEGHLGLDTQLRGIRALGGQAGRASLQGTGKGHTQAPAFEGEAGGESDRSPVRYVERWTE